MLTLSSKPQGLEAVRFKMNDLFLAYLRSQVWSWGSQDRGLRQFTGGPTVNRLEGNHLKAA